MGTALFIGTEVVDEAVMSTVPVVSGSGVKNTRDATAEASDGKAFPEGSVPALDPNVPDDRIEDHREEGSETSAVPEGTTLFSGTGVLDRPTLVAGPSVSGSGTEDPKDAEET